MTRATPKDIARALAVMGASIDYFPTDPLGLDVVQDSIERHVFGTDELRSLVRIACDTMRRWSLPEFLLLRTSVSERLFYERETLEQERKLREWKKEAKLLGPGDPDPFPIPSDAFKRIPGDAPPAPPPATDPTPPPKPIKRIPSLREAEAELNEQLAQNKRRSEEETARLLADLELQLGLKKLTETQ